MSFNLSVSRTEQFTKEVTLHVCFKELACGCFQMTHVDKLDISNSGLVSVFCNGIFTCTFLIDDVKTMSYIPLDKTNDDKIYIIYSGDFV